MTLAAPVRGAVKSKSQSAFMRGFIDDWTTFYRLLNEKLSQSAFMRGFIDDLSFHSSVAPPTGGLNPRSCAASSMTIGRP